jgi:threonine dehydrogenase-like Zn-dependent dehydrogenase
MEAHGFAIDNMADAVKQKVGIGADRAHVLRQAIMACRKGGRVSVPGVYGGLTDKFPTGALMEKGLQLRTGQTHVHKYTQKLLAMIEDGTLDTTFLISHHLPLEDAPKGYRNFHGKQNEWTKVILRPGMERENATATQERMAEPA